MKRLICLLLCCLLVQGAALAEEDTQSVLTSMEGYYGVWGVCSSNGEYEYLVLHEDGTYEAYDAWPIAQMPTPGDALIRHGAYTFDPSNGAFTLEGDPLQYTLLTYSADGMLSDDGSVEGTSDMQTLLLYAPSTNEDGEYDEPSKGFLPMSDGIELLPTNVSLSADSFEWNRSDTFHDYTLDAVSYRFAEDGTGVFMTPTNGDECDVEQLTYTMDNGAMTVTMADGTTHHWLMQYSYYIYDGENSVEIDESMEKFFEDLDDDFVVGDAMWTDAVILVRDLENGTTFYLIASEG